MEIEIKGKKMQLAVLKWNDIAKMEEKFGFIDLKPGKSMVQARYACFLSLQRAGHKDITEEILGNEIEQDAMPGIITFLFPEKREEKDLPLA